LWEGQLWQTRKGLAIAALPYSKSLDGWDLERPEMSALILIVLLCLSGVIRRVKDISSLTQFAEKTYVPRRFFT